MSAAHPTWSQRLLGGFVVLQIVFLAAGNFLPFFPHGRVDPGELMDDIALRGRAFESDLLQGGLEIAGAATRRYGEMTGQMQGWSLFAPLVAPQSPFLVTELRWTDADGRALRTQKVASRFEPADRKNFLYLPGGDMRLFNYEFRVSHAMWFMTDEGLADEPQRWKEWVPARVTKQQRSMRAYLRMQAAAYVAAHPDEPPPNELVLAVKLYPIAPPNAAADFCDDPVERPMIRWRPAMKGSHATESLEYFDPIDREFVALATTGESAHE